MIFHSVKWIPNIWEWTHIGIEDNKIFWPPWIGEYISAVSGPHSTFTELLPLEFLFELEQ